MDRHLASCFLLVLVLIAAGGSTADVADDPLSHLDFEECGTTEGISPWRGKPPGTFGIDDQVVHSGEFSGHIVRDANSPRQFSVFTTSLPTNAEGNVLELVGWLRTDNVDGWAGLWVREDGDSGSVQFDNMQQRALSGTNDWTECRIVLPLDEQARSISFGALIAGTGEVWVDDLQLLVDGKPFVEAPQIAPVLTVLDHDTEFDDGSGVTTTSVEPWRAESLATLGMVWGFLKYHHPAVTGGERHWDYDLLRGLAQVLESPDAAAARAATRDWALALGEPVASDPAGGLPESGVHLAPDRAWLYDSERLGADLAAYLRRVREARAAGPQFYVGSHPGVGNPKFLHEPAYDQFDVPDPGFRLLALFRFWNIIDLWFPYRDLIGEDWDAVLVEFVPHLLAAEDAESYDLALLALIARVHDTHANLWSHVQSRPPRGDAKLPVAVRFVGDQAVVWHYMDVVAGPMTGLEIGDVIIAVDGVTVDELRAQWSPYYAASNEPTRLRDIGRHLTSGAVGPCTITVERGGETHELLTRRDGAATLKRRLHDRPGDTFQILDGDVAYLKLSSVVAADCRSYIEKAAATRGLIVDIRNYPSEFVPFALGGHLVRERTPFVRFTSADLGNPGAFLWTDPLSIEPLTPFFAGPVVVLVDETSQSQAEYTAMALRAGHDTIVMGSITAGADGNVSKIPLPGGRRSMISGIGVFYPDKSPTQRVGIVPDVVVTPTVAGLAAGRDEVLEAAVAKILE